MPPLHYYPADLAAALRQHWPAAAPPLPAPGLLTAFLSTLYQASLPAGEGRPVICHAALASQAELEAQATTLIDFHLLRPKHWVLPGQAGPRFPALAQAVVRRLAALGEVSWLQYQQAHDAELLSTPK